MYLNLEKAKKNKFYALILKYLSSFSVHSCGPCKLCFHGNFQQAYGLFVNVQYIGMFVMWM